VTATRYRSVVLDVDSTLTGIEGIDWLAARRGPDVHERIAAATQSAMRGDTPLDAVYGERLALVRPTRAEIAALGEAYVGAAAPGAREAIAELHRHGVHVSIVSGGIRDAIEPLASHVGVASADLHAVALRFDAAGEYAGYDVDSPLWRSGGKPVLVRSLHLEPRILAMGDGVTDAELRDVVATFVAFTGFTRHERVVAAADAEIVCFDALPPLVLR
jgi:phosphoserine phosphatase